MPVAPHRLATLTTRAHVPPPPPLCRKRLPKKYAEVMHQPRPKEVVGSNTTKNLFDRTGALRKGTEYIVDAKSSQNLELLEAKREREAKNENGGAGGVDDEPDKLSKFERAMQLDAAADDLAAQWEMTEVITDEEEHAHVPEEHDCGGGSSGGGRRNLNSTDSRAMQLRKQRARERTGARRAPPPPEDVFAETKPFASKMDMRRMLKKLSPLPDSTGSARVKPKLFGPRGPPTHARTKPACLTEVGATKKNVRYPTAAGC